MGKRKQKIPIWLHNPRNDTSTNPKFIRVYHDLMLNKNFMSLKKSSKLVYFYMLDYSVGNREFEFPHSIYSKIASRQTFQESIKELTENGFIEIIECGQNTRTPNKYQFSSKWYSTIN